MDVSGSDVAADASREELARRPPSRSRAVTWVLVDGSRLGLAFRSSVLVFLALVFLAELDVVAFTNPNSLTRMASGMIAGTFSLVTVVVSINQLILSQEFSPAGQYRDRRDGVESFYHDVADAAGVASAPTAPTRLLTLLATVVQDRARRLGDAARGHPGEESCERVVDLATAVEAGTRRLKESLEESEDTTFDALSTAMEYDDARILYEVRRRRNDVPVRSAALDGAFEDLIRALRLVDTAKEHLKTIYLQRELTRFSQLTIYLGIPAVLAALLVVLLYGAFDGPTLSLAVLPYVISFLATLVVLPLLLLASFILRTATITRRTAPIGPLLSGGEVDGPSEAPVDSSERSSGDGATEYSSDERL